MDYLWINKYRPIKLEQFIGNKSQCVKFLNWLDILVNPKNTIKSRGIIVNGNHGLGKTLAIKLLLKTYNYSARIINPNDIKDLRLADEFEDYYNFETLSSKINFESDKTGFKKIAIIFDETENITLASEKKYIMEIHKTNNKLKSFPLIFICNNQHSKLLNELKKTCPELIWSIPPDSELIDFVKYISSKEGITWQDSNLINKLIDLCQNDIRRLITLLQELSLHSKHITLNIITEFILKTREKDTGTGLFDSTLKILNEYNGFNSINSFYSFEKVLLPPTVQENYPKKLLITDKMEKSDIDHLLNKIIDISDSISIGDNIETSIYMEQNWYLHNIHSFYTCVKPSFILSDMKTNKLEYSDVKFSSDINKTSLKKINRKNIISLSKIIPNRSVQDLLIISRIANTLMKSNNINDEDKLINILKSYKPDLNIKDFELCLKIDKTYDFIILTQKEKKRIELKLKEFNSDFIYPPSN